ncbi:Protein CBG14876 [Caenorhabditis briggsae]|uniref:Skp1-related protein n=2 Tax=Caenorhabditis briggsae TaxID=6238 RepID=A8XKW4_CAEBR|nr:Protein CBG14876 [Caenorhabditis briggsae]ULU09957.1 hypothetical protein L3Y34_014366 [Caenorhabditis briggsae]CAP33288.1 Protein CBG14876 [Caenorhabditis briggsae]
MLSFQTSDGQIVDASKMIFLKSTVVQNAIIKNRGVAPEVIRLDGVTGTTLKHIIHFLEHYKDAPVEVGIPRELTDFDKEFFQSAGNPELFKMTCAAHSMDIRLLTVATATYIAHMAEGKSTEELRNMFGIPTDSEDEERANEEEQESNE